MRKSLLLVAALVFTCFAAATAQADNHEEIKPGLFGTTILEGWTKSIGVGITGSSGNANGVNATANAKGDYESEKTRRKFQANFFIAKPDSRAAAGNPPTDRKAFVEYEENYKPFDNSVYLLGTIRYDYDRFLVSNSRIAPSLGVGMDLINTEDLIIRGSVGAGINHTWDHDGDTVPEGVLRASADYKITEGIDFTTTNTYYPNFDRTQDLRIISVAELKADIGEEGGLAASVGINNKYDTAANNDNKEIKTNDLIYFMRLGYDF